MHSRRVTTTWLLVLVAVVLSLPAAAIASGPSAGDNQYTDPLAGQGSHHGSGGSHSQTSSTPQTPTPTASGSSGTPTTPPSSTSPTPSTASSTSSSSSSSSSPAATTAASSSRTLPRTGFDAGLAAAIGAALIGIGLMTRRRIRCPSR